MKKATPDLSAALIRLGASLVFANELVDITTHDRFSQGIPHLEYMNQKLKESIIRIS